MHVWGHLRFGALLRYAGIALLFVIVGVGLYFQFGPQAISYVSGFGKNSDAPLVVSDLPAQQATVITTGEDWKRTLNTLILPPEDSTASTSEYVPSVVDDLIAEFIREKYAAQSGGKSVDPKALVQEYFKDAEYGPSTLSFSDDVFIVSNDITEKVYAERFLVIATELDSKTTSQSLDILKKFRTTYNTEELRAFQTLLPAFEDALDKLLDMPVPPGSLALHKQAAESVLNNIHQIQIILSPKSDVINISYALSAFVNSFEEGEKILRKIMVMR